MPTKTNNTEEVIDLLKQALELLGAGTEEETAAETVELPKADDVDELDPVEIKSLCEAYGISTEGSKSSALKLLLKTACAIKHDETDDVDQDDAEALCAAVGVAPAKKLPATIAALAEYLEGASSGADGEAEADDTEDADEEDEKPAKKSKKAVEADEDEEDEKPAKKGKKPAKEDEEEEPVAEEVDEDTMQERLDAYNEAADEDSQIAIKKGKLAAAYAELVTKMTDRDGNVAEWGVAYTDDEDNILSCGLPVTEAKKPKGGESEGQYCKCVVTGNLTHISDEAVLTPHEA